MEKQKNEGGIIWLYSLDEVFDRIGIKDGMCLSFHHHLRNGDLVMNMAAAIIAKRNLKNIKLAASAVFPINEPLVPLIVSGNIVDIDTDYLNGSVSDVVTSGLLQGELIMRTHGGRARAIERGELKIDVAFIAAPTVDKEGNGTGAYGKSACGPLGYAVADSKYADCVVLVTDNMTAKLSKYEIDGKNVDYVVVLDKIGDSSGIISGTTMITKNPAGIGIARNTVRLLDELGLIKEGMTMQTGAGGISLAAAFYIKKLMKEKGIKGKFAVGGITAGLAEMLEEGLLEALYDVQCFDREAVRSFRNHPRHYGIGASQYANPDDDPIVNKLDFTILGATEIDLDFNVNVTTDSHGNIIGGSGGHADSAHGAGVTVIVADLIRSRLPVIRKKVNTITTPGRDVDVFICERGIAINPLRTDLLGKIKESKLKIMTIKELEETALRFTGKPDLPVSSRIKIGKVIYRDGSISDYLYRK